MIYVLNICTYMIICKYQSYIYIHIYIYIYIYSTYIYIYMHILIRYVYSVDHVTCSTYVCICAAAI